MYSLEQTRIIASLRPHHKKKAEYLRWRRACQKLGISTSHEIKTPKIIRERNRRWKLEHSK